MDQSSSGPSMLGGVRGSSCSHRPPSARRTSWGSRRTPPEPDPSCGSAPGVRRNLSRVSATTTRSSARANFCPMQFLWTHAGWSVSQHVSLYRARCYVRRWYLGPEEKGMKAWEEWCSLLVGSNRRGSNSWQRQKKSFLKLYTDRARIKVRSCCSFLRLGLSKPWGCGAFHKYWPGKLYLRGSLWKQKF